VSCGYVKREREGDVGGCRRAGDLKSIMAVMMHLIVSIDRSDVNVVRASRFTAVGDTLHHHLQLQ
jgi:hypothetical protein